jgi:tight adherence protein C
MDIGLGAFGQNSMLLDTAAALAALAILLAARALSIATLNVPQSLLPVGPATRAPRRAHRLPEDLIARIGRMAIVRSLGHEARLRQRLEAAGSPMTVDLTRGLALVAAISGAAPFVLIGTTPRFAVLPLAVSIPIGWAASRVPELALARRGRRRKQRMAGQVADLAELLVATTGAGLNPPLALRRAAEILDGPLGEELRVAIRGLDLGTPWRVVLDELAARTADASIRRLVRAMGRSQRLGTSLASALGNVAEDLRGERQARAEEMARRAPVKMLFPLVFLILPAFLLLTVGPVLLATLRSLH